MKSVRILIASGAMAVVAGCIPQPAPQPAPEPEAPRVVTPPPPPASPPEPEDWRDIPLTPGDWHYRQEAGGSSALFGPDNGEASFIIRCDKGQRRIVLSHPGATSGNAMTIRTSFGERAFPVSVRTAPSPSVDTTLAPSDPFLDSMAFSRGRFTVAVPGTPMLVIPSWAEPSRVIEDCRS